jgi:hypothetical protein
MIQWFDASARIKPTRAPEADLKTKKRTASHDGVPVRLSESAVVIQEGFIAVGWASEAEYDAHAVAGGNRYGCVRVRRG